MNFMVFLIVLIVVSGLLTFLIRNRLEGKKNMLMSFIQFFLGFLFIVSGFVKAVDPLGTSYKMEEYFQEFQSLFEPTWFSFLTPFFGFLEHYSLGIGIMMILFETILGIMIIIGFRPKLTSWLYLIIVLFFAILTGYTYLTGYVPQGVNFFSFSSWGEFAETNMKVTDCGCFGDFIKISAFDTFLKNIIFLIPIIYMLFRSKDMHQFSNKIIRGIIVLSSIVLLLLFNLSNYKWGLPIVDFRPFKEGVDVPKQMALELEAMVNVREIAVLLKNKNTGQIVELPKEQYEATISEYPDSIWMIKDRLMTEPEIPQTELSDLAIEDFEGNDMTASIFSIEGYHFLVVSSKMMSDAEPYTYTVKDSIFGIDTIFKADTIFVNDSVPYVNNDSMMFKKTLREVVEKEMQGYNYIWESDYLKAFMKDISPLVRDAKKDNINVDIVAPCTIEMIEDFKKDGAPDTRYFTADDITLKTIIRSNPGVVLLKKGVIVKKWHYKKLPDYETIKAEYMN